MYLEVHKGDEGQQKASSGTSTNDAFSRRNRGGGLRPFFRIGDGFTLSEAWGSALRKASGVRIPPGAPNEAERRTRGVERDAPRSPFVR